MVRNNKIAICRLREKKRGGAGAWKVLMIRSGGNSFPYSRIIVIIIKMVITKRQIVVLGVTFIDLSSLFFLSVVRCHLYISYYLPFYLCFISFPLCS